MGARLDRARLHSEELSRLLLREVLEVSQDEHGAVTRREPAERLAHVNAVVEMSRMMEVMRTYTHISTLMQQQNDLQKTAIEKLADVPA